MKQFSNKTALERFRLLEHDAMQSDRNVPAFRKDILPQSSSTLKVEAAGPTKH